jgi:uncharacterized protein
MKKILLVVVTMLMLGSVWSGDYEDGEAAYKKEDHGLAIKKFRAAAAKGHAGAQYALGWIYVEGKGVAQNTTAAVKWYKLAAAQGYQLAQSKLGYLYYNEPAIKDYSKAAKWYRLIAKQGDASAQYMLGYMYMRGQGVEQDNVRAHMWLSLAASIDDPNAEFHLDIITGKMKPQQIVKAQYLARDCQDKQFKGCD